MFQLARAVTRVNRFIGKWASLAVLIIFALLLIPMCQPIFAEKQVVALLILIKDFHILYQQPVSDQQHHLVCW